MARRKKRSAVYKELLGRAKQMTPRKTLGRLAKAPAGRKGQRKAAAY